MMSDIVNTSYDYSPIGVGNNEFETGIITVPAGGTVKGRVVVRTSGKWVPGTSATVIAGAGLGVLVEDYDNSGSSAVDSNGRILISGKVNATNVTVAGTALTAAQKDLLRANSIVAVEVTQI